MIDNVRLRSAAMPASVISIGCPGDWVLHRIGPLALGAAAPPAVVVDLDGSSPPLPGSLSLADLVVDGVHSRYLNPPKSGVAVLPNGGVTRDQAAEVIAALASSWPAVVLREALPETQIIPLVVGMPLVTPSRPAIYQPSGRMLAPPGPGLLLPSLSRSVASSLIRGTLPLRQRWIRAWAAVWEAKWA